MTRTHSVRISAAAGAIALAFALGGCSAVSGLFGGGAPDRDEDTNQVKEGGEYDVFQLQVGDCLNLGDEGELSEASVVPCDEPHTQEIFHEFELTGDEWPGDDALNTDADEGCYSAFAEFVGVPYEESVLNYFFLAPTEAGWTDSSVADRLVQCLIYEADDNDEAVPVTGTLKGAAR
ncbi:septum formation family protein [Microbacterium phosphatis]|uniref:septum formation family protein n=1 Tax=Microbacterium phosphatis TaxID=3140248 RepID=UPI0031409852